MNQTIEEMFYDIKLDLMGVKTDVIWLKRGFSMVVIGVFALLGLDATGVMEA